MNNTIKVLDHGFVKLLNISGAVRRIELEGKPKPFDAEDIDPAMCARISFNNLDKVRSKEQDLRLCKYLMENRHNTPVEMTEVWLEMKLPFFVARQFVRHRTATLNEVSARYSVLPEEFYIPEVVRGKGSNNKQGSIDNLSPPTQLAYKSTLKDRCTNSYKAYLEFLDLGVAPEVARNFLHVNHYTHWIWKQDLSNLMHFLSLRLHVHTQWESRQYAEAIYSLLKTYLPETMKLFDTYKRI